MRIAVTSGHAGPLASPDRVDAVVIFDGATNPRAVLSRPRPDIWAGQQFTEGRR